MDDAAWLALTLSLTVLGGIWTWSAFGRRGVASGTRALAVTLLVPAAYLTRTLRLFTEIAREITDWATHLVFNPMVWLGIALAGISVLLFGVSGRLSRRAEGDAEVSARKPERKVTGGARPAAGAPAVDPEMAEIEALLRKRGIS